MGKKAFPRRLSETEAKAGARALRTSPRKLGLVAGLIRGKDVNEALAQLNFCKRRIADNVKKVLQAAVANAENNHQLDVDRLFVAEVSVGRAMVMRRFRPRARGRVGNIRKPFSNLIIVVRERAEAA